MYRFGFIVVTLIFMVVPFSGVAHAASTMTDNQRKALGRGVLYFDTEEDASCTTSDNTVSVTATGDHPKDAYNFFIANGFTPAQAAGIVGNLQRESTIEIDPTANNGTHYGIAQWGGDRLIALKSYAASKGKDKSDFQLQLDFIIHELNTSENAAKRAINAASTVEAAAAAWNEQYERSDETDSGPRIKLAEAVFTTYSGGDIGTVMGSSVSACASTTSPDCVTASGNAKILCNAQAYNGVYYKWGGGHNGYTNFIKTCPDPSNPPNNQPNGGSDSHNGNPSPCGVDCSGLVSIAVSAAFGVDKTWTVKTMQQDTTDWKEIPINNVQSGDVVTREDDHVEIVDHYDPTTRKLYVFGAHKTGDKTSQKITELSYWTGGAYRYIGIGGTE